MKRPPWSVWLGIVLGYLVRPKRLPTPEGAPPHDPEAPPEPWGKRSCRFCGEWVPREAFAAHVVAHYERGDRRPEV